VFVEGAERKTDIRGGLGSTESAANGFRVGEGGTGSGVALQCACGLRRVDIAEDEDVRRGTLPTFESVRDNS
jgi:hypothetical protein